MQYRDNPLVPLAQSLLAWTQSVRPQWVSRLVGHLDSALAREEIDFRYSNHIVARSLVRDLVVAKEESLPTANAHEGIDATAYWPELHIRTLSEGYLDTASALVFVNDMVVSQSGTFTRRARDASLLSGASIRLGSSPTLHIEGTVAGVGDLWHHYHFMLETLPQILRIQRMLPETTFVTSSPVAPQAKQALDFLELNLIELGHPRVVTADQLVVCDRGPQFMPRPSDVQLLAQTFDPWRGEAHRKNIIYSSRQGSSRNPANIVGLEEVLARHGVEVVNFNHMPLQRQVKIAARAQVLIGCHGAGLVNSIFQEAGATLLEISSGFQFENCYQYIAQAKSLNYTFVQLHGSPEHPHGHVSDADIDKVLGFATSAS